MHYRFLTVDVFTKHAFGGNPLAVLPDAAGLSSERMQQIAREFNYSETTFVLPPEDSSNTRQVRIFTPYHELPFAGHPNIGTAFVLVACGDVSAAGEQTTLRFEEQAGLVPVRVDSQDGKPVRAELTAPQAPSRGAELDAAQVAQLLALAADEIVSTRHPPCLASAGSPYLCVELRDLDALARSRVVADQLDILPSVFCDAGFLLYTAESEDNKTDFRARMYAPTHGIAEDPATGGAAVALAGLLALLDERSDGELSWRIAQGVEMGRPSLLEAAASKQGGRVTAVRVGGSAVLLMEGTIAIPQA